MELNCYDVGKYEISDLCLLTYPCQHFVTNTETGEASRMSGDKIFCMLRDEKLSHPHFAPFAECVIKRDNPTPEEIAERDARKKQRDEQLEKHKKEQEEREKLINTYKASSRLERLKAKNNATGNAFA